MGIYEEINTTKAALRARTETLAEEDRFVESAWLLLLLSQLGALSNNILTRAGNPSRRRRLLKLAATVVSAIEALDLHDKILEVQQYMIFKSTSPGKDQWDVHYNGLVVAHVAERTAAEPSYSLALLPDDHQSFHVSREAASNALAIYLINGTTP